MNKFVIISGVVALIVLMAVAYVLISPEEDDGNFQTNGTTSFPIGSNGGGNGTSAAETKLIQTATGKNITVRNFIANDTTVTDPHNPGYYYLGNHFPFDGSAQADPPFTITYIESTQFFNIGIYAEPLGEVRKQAEQYLKNQLGISEEDMCTLNYSLSTTVHVNPYYGGTSLGFSFCKGSAAL
jgi:hypothetical protein